MRYYKIINDGEIVGYQTHEEKLEYDYLVEISEEEYNSEIDKLKAIAAEEAKAAEQSKDDRIAELEAENAALLYQVLTGEELSDV